MSSSPQVHPASPSRTPRPTSALVRFTAVALLATAVLLSAATPSQSIWYPGGTPVCLAPGEQEDLQAVADGQGGILMAWTDYRGASADIYAQRVDANGDPLWTADGLAVCTLGSDQLTPHLCADGSGGAWVVWEDHRTDPPSLYGQHLDAGGNPIWGPLGSGMLISELVADAGPEVGCVSDGSGGAIISWTQDTFLGPLPFATHLNTAGTEIWGSGGVTFGDGIDIVPYNRPIEIVFDAPYTFLAYLWQEQVVLQRLDANGLVTWGPAVHPAAPPLTTEWGVQICSDGAGGIITMWRGRVIPGLNYFTYAQRLNSLGQSLWLGTPDGVEIAVTSPMAGGTTGPYLVEDGQGGVAAIWNYSNMGVGYIAAQRLDPAGTKMWGDPYLDLQSGIPSYWNPQIIRSGSEFVCAWGPIGEIDVRVQRVSLAGSPLWPELASIDPADGGNLNLVNGSGDRALLAFGRRESPTETVLDLYAASLESDGRFTGPNLVVTDVVLADDPGEITVETTAQVTIQNVGSQASGPFSTCYFLDRDTPPGVGQTPQGPTLNHPGLAPGETYVWTTDPFRSLFVTTWTSWAFVDYTGQVVEADGEDDNLYGPIYHQWLSRPNLKITSYQISDNKPGLGEPVTVEITVENDGHADAGAFRIDWYQDLSVSPALGQAGDQSHQVASLAVGASTTWTTAAVTGTSLDVWSTWAQVDTQDDQAEWKENDNVYGPRGILWMLPMQKGWPVSTGSQCTSPAIGTLDKGMPGSRQVVVACLDGRVHALDYKGESLPGWPYRAQQAVQGSPALGDVTGDEALEVVFGSNDGKLYCVSAEGRLLWEFTVSETALVTITPVLTQLTRDPSLEIVIGSGEGKLFALDGDGKVLSGWPVDLGLPILVSPAAGEMDGSPGVEIVAIGTSVEKAPQSVLYVLDELGANYSGAWPMNLSTQVFTPPALGNVGGDSEMEIVFGDQDGNLHVWTLGGQSGPFPLALGGLYATTPALLDVGNDGVLEIAIATMHQILPELRWETSLTVVDGFGQALPGWPHMLSSSIVSIRPGAGPVVWQEPGKKESRIGLGITTGDCVVFDQSGAGLVHQSMGTAGPITGSAAVGELDADMHMEMVIAGDGEIACYEMLAGTYRPDLLSWPMFRHDMNRTGAYGHDSVTGVPGAEVPEAPVVTRLGRPHPNPFNALVNIPFTLARDGRVEMEVFDVAGRRIRRLTQETWPTGGHSVEWNGRDDAGGEVASGVYLVRMVTVEGSEAVRVVLVK